MSKEVITSVSKIMLSVENILETCVRNKRVGGEELVDGVRIDISRPPPSKYDGLDKALRRLHDQVRADLKRQKEQNQPPNLNSLGKVAERKRYGVIHQM
jgi:hypothetical protein